MKYAKKYSIFKQWLDSNLGQLGVSHHIYGFNSICKKIIDCQIRAIQLAIKFLTINLIRFDSISEIYFNPIISAVAAVERLRYSKVLFLAVRRLPIGGSRNQSKNFEIDTPNINMVQN